MLSNQFKILEKLYPEEKEYLEEDRKAIEDGYVIHYQEILDRFISIDELPIEASGEVLDILGMYRTITFSYMKLSNKAKEAINSRFEIKFVGFDANDSYEIKLLMYTRYFIVDKERFPELVNDKEYPDFNSHRPMLNKYRNMLKLYNHYGTNELSEHQLNDLLGIN